MNIQMALVLGAAAVAATPWQSGSLHCRSAADDALQAHVAYFEFPERDIAIEVGPRRRAVRRQTAMSVADVRNPLHLFRS